MKDLVSNVTVVASIPPASRAAASTTNGTAVSLVGANSAVVLFYFGALGGGTGAVKIQESADGSNDWVDVADSRLSAAPVAAVADTLQAIGITDIGGLTKTFIRPVIAITGGSGTLCSAAVVKGNLKITPSGDNGSIYIS